MERKIVPQLGTPVEKPIDNYKFDVDKKTIECVRNYKLYSGKIIDLIAPFSFDKLNNILKMCFQNISEDNVKYKHIFTQYTSQLDLCLIIAVSSGVLGMIEYQHNISLVFVKNLPNCKEYIHQETTRPSHIPGTQLYSVKKLPSVGGSFGYHYNHNESFSNFFHYLYGYYCPQTIKTTEDYEFNIPQKSNSCWLPSFNVNLNTKWLDGEIWFDLVQIADILNYVSGVNYLIRYYSVKTKGKFTNATGLREILSRSRKPKASQLMTDLHLY